jgi:hypothetical protein
MKILFILLILTGCAFPPPIARNAKKKLKPYSKKIKICTLDLIGKHGVEAQKAVKVCKNIYRAK